MKLLRLALVAASASLLMANVADAGGEYLFRYKAALAEQANDSIGDKDGVCEPGESGPEDCDGHCAAGEEGTPDCPAAENPGDDDEGPGDTPVNTVAGDVGDPVEANDPAAPSPLKLKPTTGKLTVGPSRIVYQCYEASGGWGNYTFAVPTPPDGDWSWIESYDVVMKSKLGSSSFPGSWFPPERYYVAPNADTTSGKLTVSHGEEACIRAKVRQNVASEAPATLYLLVNDYADSVVVNDKVTFADYWADDFVSTSLTLDPECAGGCNFVALDDLQISGPEEVTMHPGDTLALWTAQGDPNGIYDWGVGNVSGYCYETCWVGFEDDPVTGGSRLFVRDLPDVTWEPSLEVPIDGFYPSEGTHYLYVTVKDTVGRSTFVPLALHLVR